MYLIAISEKVFKLTSFRNCLNASYINSYSLLFGKQVKCVIFCYSIKYSKFFDNMIKKCDLYQP